MQSKLIERIEELQDSLRELKLKIESATATENARANEEIVIGDWVKVLNPNITQESEGKVVKVNSDTGYLTIEGKRLKRRIVRKKKNVKKITPKNKQK